MFAIKFKRLVFVLITLFQYTSLAVAQIVINEIMPANISSIQDEFDVDKQTCPVEDCDWWFEQMGQATCDGNYPDWIELYNISDNSINLSGYGLSDNPDEPLKWTFPSITIGAKKRLVVFASGKDIKNPAPLNYMHTNFKIDNDGETLLLTNPSGTIIDQVAMEAVPPDFSCGRKTDGNQSWVVFQHPTPNSPNQGIIFKGFTEQVNSSDKAGFYDSALSVSLSSTSSTAQIRYTTDGSTPDKNSSIYVSSIDISGTTVLKARSYSGDTIKSEVMTATYLIHNQFSMPVVSISTDPKNLWSKETGIYVHGNYPEYHERVANYWQDWERPVTIEFFEVNGNREFTINAGTKILGWGSRANARKSLSIFFRDKYGESRLTYPIFDHLPFNTYKSLVLRSAGGDWQGTLIRDVFASDLVADKNLDYQKFRPAIVYINGEYWGIHNIREKLNEDYLDSHYTLDKDNVDMISRYWRSSKPIVIEGTDAAYLEMENYLSEKDMNTYEAYDYAKYVIDLDNLTDYLTTEIYYANYDWPGNNIKCWKPHTAGSKWRWLLYDVDYTMNSHQSQNDYTHNTLVHATTTDGAGWPNTPITTLLIRKILESNEFRNTFVNRMADYMNTRFIADTAIARLQGFKDMYAPEIQEHIDKWGPYGSTLTSVNQWNNNISDIESFFENRSPYVKNHILEFFNLDSWSNFSMNASGKGKIKINSIIPDSYPWTGQYVNEIPVILTALPDSGYKFIGWTGPTAIENNPHLTVSISEIPSITANFTASSANPSIIINEVNYNSNNTLNAGDWIELYNPYSYDVDLSGWKFKDSDVLHEFIFSTGTQIAADSYLVICADSSDFEEAFPTVNNYIGTFNFGLGSDVEVLLLYNADDNLIDSISYSSSSPWPTQPNGFGPTLSFIETCTDNSYPNNWGYSVGYGTPGAKNHVNFYNSKVNIEEYISHTDSDIILDQNYPNPFSSVTYIPLYLTHADKVTLSVIDVQGKEVDHIFSGYMSNGNHVIEYRADHLPHGLYYYKLENSKQVITKKMVKL